MNTYVIVHLSNLSVNTYYQADEPNYSMFGGENGNPQASVHLPVPDGLSWDTVMGVQDSEGNVTLQADPTKVASKTQAQWTSLRAQRNQLLAASDWTQGNDSPLSTESKSAWATYRQALRNLPDVTSDPSQVTWPTPPS